jgi:hypothetical protein
VARLGLCGASPLRTLACGPPKRGARNGAGGRPGHTLVVETPSEPRLPPWEELRALAEEALAASRLPDPLSANASPNLVVGFAVAARCRTLMRAITIVTESGLGEVAGITVRTMYEDWLVGIYALHGGIAAMERLVVTTRRVSNSP